MESVGAQASVVESVGAKESVVESVEVSVVKESVAESVAVLESVVESVAVSVVRGSVAVVVSEEVICAEARITPATKAAATASLIMIIAIVEIQRERVYQ